VIAESISVPRRKWAMPETVSDTGESVVIGVSSDDSSDNRKIRGSVQQLSGKSLTPLVDEKIAAAADVRVQPNCVVNQFLRHDHYGECFRPNDSGY
jgi:hypothetical protein